MEDVLIQVITISNNFPEIQNAAQGAIDLLRVQQGLIRDPAHELRAKCLSVLQLCLETKRSKFMGLAIVGFHKIIRDDRFHSNIEPEDDSKWLPPQLLQATSCFLSLPDDTQVDILKILLNIACSKKWTMNGRIIIAIISLCSEAFDSGNAAIRAAAQAAASQTLRSFCIILEEDFEGEKDTSNFNDVIPVMQFICSKIDEAESSGHCEHGVVFLLECLLTLCSNLPHVILHNSYLKVFFWQKLCPVLITVLGTPRVDKFIVTRSSEVEKERGRGSGCLGTAPSLSSFHAKTVYSINAELIRLLGSVGSLRPVLESVFHRVLLYPAPEHRVDALRATAELVRNPNRLLDIAGPLIEENQSSVCNMSLLRLIMDSIEESSKSDFSVMQASVVCCFGLLKGLEELSLGRCIPGEIAQEICQMYPGLTDCDYTGPRTYQSIDRLPKPYRERIQKAKELLSQISADNSIGKTENEHYESDSSGDTEGPENENVSDDQEIEVEISKDKRILRVLDFQSYSASLGGGDKDRQHARHFVEALYDFLLLLMPMRSSIQVDQAFQSFASQHCESLRAEQAPNNLTADGVYLGLYATLLLDMTLFQSDYYSSPNKNISEEDFLKKVKDIGAFASSSDVWLRELYQTVASSSLLKSHGYLPTNNNSQPHALINLLNDVEGLGSYQHGSQMLWECRRLEKTTVTNDDSIEREAGLRLSRRILTCCWDSVLKVLAAPLSQKRPFSKIRLRSKSKKLRDFKFLRNENHKLIKEIITTSLEGLQIAARLCNTLGLQDRCDGILELLASASCPDYISKKMNLFKLQSSNGEIVSLTPSHALSLDLLLSSGLELGSHCYKCWPHVFRCCIYVKKLEHKYFSKSENRALGSTTKVTRKEQGSGLLKDADLTFDPQLMEEDTCVDVYSFLCSTELPQTVSELVSGQGQTSVDILKSSKTAKVICVLSQLVDKLFEDAALKLNLKALESFSKALCTSSHVQLFPPTTNERNRGRNWWQKFTGYTSDSDDTLLLDSVGEIMLKCVRSGRPLFHIMKIWAIIGPHLMESACHKDLTISRKAIKHIHDTVNAILTENSELPHFHMNENLFKPFENLLCLELCEPDIQDQIVSCICEFVETSFSEIRSGWRPLFGALKAVSTNMNILLDVFRVFLETDNASVFANAAIDYIMCLLKHLRVQSSGVHNTKAGFEILKYIKICETVLGSMYKMPHCLIFQTAHHIQVSDGLLVDPVISDFEVFNFSKIPTDLKFELEIHYSQLMEFSANCYYSLDSIDRPSGVLRVWFLLLEGVHSAAISANSEFQPPILEMLFGDLLNFIDNPGPLFGLFVFNKLILPMTQSWLRQLSKIQDGDFSGLKHSIGLLSDLVLAYFERLHSNEVCEKLLTLLLCQVFLLLAECCIHPIPAVAKIGPACIRHIIVRVGRTFNPVQWELCVLALHRTCEITLTYLRQLMVPFSIDSHCYYGDSGQVKVAARRGSASLEIITSKQLSQQVFLLHGQRENFNISYEENVEDQKVYTFLVNISEEEVVRIPMKSLVISLLSHQSILQTIADTLLQGTKYHVSSLANVLKGNDSEIPKNKPGLMEYLRASDFNILLSCLNYSYQHALAFDSRPGLKFLIQKVAGLEQAANLYRQAGAAWAIKFVSLFEYCLIGIEAKTLNADQIKNFLQNPLCESDDDFSKLLKRFKITFNGLCDTYINMVLENTGINTPTHEKNETHLYFLIGSQEGPFDEVSDRKEDSHDYENSKKQYDSNLENSTPEKPFTLSEFARNFSDSSSDIDDQSQHLDDSDYKNDQNHRQLNDNEKKIILNENENSTENDKTEESEEIRSMLDVLNEYKRKKKHYSAPRRNTFRCAEQPVVPPEIEQQRRRSFLKDSEALRRVWTEMLGSVFELLQQLNDNQFRKLLPIFIDGIRRLISYISEPFLKQAVSELFQRIAIVYGIEAV